MGFVFGLAGTALIFLTVLDLLWTTFLEGAGPVTTRLCAWIGRAVLVFQNRCTTRRVVSLAGLLTVSATALAWTLMLWVGWTLVFAGSPTAVVSAAGGEPATFLERAYYAGDTISTLGLGDFRPVGGAWQLLTSVAAGSGFLLVGLAIAYLVPVVQAATQKRQLAVCVWSLGRNPADIISRAWNGVDSTALGPHLVSLTAMLALLGESHQTYPVLHYFHGTKRSSAVAPNVAALDEALTILECGLQKGCSLDLPSLGAARESITEFLNTLAPALIAPAADTPPPPSLAMLRDMGVPVVDDALFEQAVEGVVERRRLLLALVRNEAWTWEAVWGPAKGETSPLGEPVA